MSAPRPPVRITRGITPPGAAAWVPLPRTIVAAPSTPLTRRLVAHELEHVRQWEHHGWSFPIRYALAWVRAGFNYERIPCEIAARAAELDLATLAWADEVLHDG